jgi:integrase
VGLPGAISEVILSHLKAMGTIDPEALLFPYQNDFNEHYPNHALNRLWEKIRKETGYKGSIHSLRHFAGTSYGMTGATLREIMDRLGHSNTRTAMIYQKNSGRELELVQRLDSMI